MRNLVMVGMGGAIGSVLRFLITNAAPHWAMRWFGFPFPVGTMIVNLSGSLAIGILMGLFAGRLPVNDSVRLLLVTGFLGGYTTFSSYAYETIALAGGGNGRAAWMNVFAQNAAALLLVWIGFKGAQLLFGSVTANP